jgi:enterobactin synthetase component D
VRAQRFFEERSEARLVRAVGGGILTMPRAFDHPELFRHTSGVVELARELGGDRAIVRSGDDDDGSWSDVSNDIDGSKVLDIHVHPNGQHASQLGSNASAFVEHSGLLDRIAKGTFEDNSPQTLVEGSNLRQDVGTGRESDAADSSLGNVWPADEVIDRTFQCRSFRGAKPGDSTTLSPAGHVEQKNSVAGLGECASVLDHSIARSRASMAEDDGRTGLGWDIPSANRCAIPAVEGNAAKSEGAGVGRHHDPRGIGLEIAPLRLITAEPLGAFPGEKKKAEDSHPAQRNHDHRRHEAKTERSGGQGTGVLITLAAERCQDWQGETSPFREVADDRAILGMGLRRIAAPATLNGFDWVSAVEILGGIPSSTYPRTRGFLPHQLSRAAPKRIAEFLAGRYCAALALNAGGCWDGFELGIGSAGSPVWPAGLLGSITHTSRIAVAVVARKTEFRGIGIDSEPIMTSRSADDVAPIVIPEAAEVALARNASSAMDWRTFITAVFSAKESIYKCLRPLADEFFEFGDVRLVNVDLDSGILRMRIARPLGGALPARMELETRFALDAEVVHTATLLL